MMMMLSASPASSIAKSSLEEMLESLRRMEESEKPKDLPPALPARPVSRGRLPSGRRSPTEFRNVGNGMKSGEISPVACEGKVKEDEKRKEGVFSSRSNSFGSNKTSKDSILDSPCNVEAVERRNSEGIAAECGVSPNVAVRKDANGYIGYFVKQKLSVWCRLPDGQWDCGTVKSTSEEESYISLANGNVVKVPNTDLFPANPETLEGVDDLRQLSFLNEPSVLHNLKCRYTKDRIYSKAGPVLIAVNPFKHIELKGHDFVTAYRQKANDCPHVYAIADTAYSQMMRDGVNQSIIISGESGSGKTATAKSTMQYLAALGGSSDGIESKILHTSSMLEAFGNAKTSRNNNSSRYGKLMEIHFSKVGKISGAKIQTLLLEKSRVVQLFDSERSYHIFYQLCAGAPTPLKEKLNLRAAKEYNYLSQSDCLVIDGVDDAIKFNELMETMDIIQISKEDREQAFSMLAAILWLGNISFHVIDNENHVEALADEAVSTAAKLLGCGDHELIVALSNHKIQAVEDNVTQKLTLQQAVDTRDSMAKFIYASLFDWLVERINKSLDGGKRDTGRSISIVDMQGFESFKNNSFEQFCINYANERLQQHFNRHLLKLVQEEYEFDGIDWNRVDFEDNQECLDLFEKKPLGLLSLLDEESNLPKATDLTFANKLKHNLNANPCFKGDRGRAFGVRHHAGEVHYDTNGFLEKNRDVLHFEIVELLSSCRHSLPELFASRMLNQSSKPASLSDASKLSAGMKFKDQLFRLLHHLENSTPHFIRCIRPNSKQSPGKFEEDLVLQQLRCCGMLDVVKISRFGYPTRITHQEFAERYGLLLAETSSSKDPLSISVAVLQRLNILPEMYQVGYTKLYLRTGQIDALEDKKNRVLKGIIAVQKYFRGHQARSHFHELKGATTIQSVIRGWMARKQFNNIRDSKRSNVENAKGKSSKKVSEVKDQPQEQQIKVLPSIWTELQRRVMRAETNLGQKEEEISVLRKQLKHYEARLSEYESKTKQEMLQKVSNGPDQPRRVSGSAGSSDEAMSVGSQSPGAASIKFGTILETRSARETNGHLTAVSNLAKEFDQQKQAFDSNVKPLTEGKFSRQSSQTNANEELRRLKLNYETWKKDFNARLKVAKARVQKLGHSEGRWKCWG